MEEHPDNPNESEQASRKLARQMLPYAVGACVAVASVTLFATSEIASHVAAGHTETMDSDNIMSAIIGVPVLVLSAFAARFLHRRSTEPISTEPVL